MPHKVRRGKRARADQLAIWTYIANLNRNAADRQIDRLDDAFFLLAEHPYSGRNYLEFGSTLRALPVDHYMIFYRVSPGTVDIVRILHAARDITPEMLTE